MVIEIEYFKYDHAKKNIYISISWNIGHNMARKHGHNLSPNPRTTTATLPRSNAPSQKAGHRGIWNMIGKMIASYYILLVAMKLCFWYTNHFSNHVWKMIASYYMLLCFWLVNMIRNLIASYYIFWYTMDLLMRYQIPSGNLT